MAGAIATAQEWGKRWIFQPIDDVVKTYNGQAVLDEVRGYISENEAVNTAVVTRVLKLESRLRVLTALVVVLVVAEIVHWIIR